MTPQQDPNSNDNRALGKVRDLYSEPSRLGVGNVEIGLVQTVEDLLLVVDVQDVTASILGQRDERIINDM